MKVSVIIPAWNGYRHLPACLDALLTQGHPDFEIIVVDNASTDGSADFVAEQYPWVKLIRNRRNLGFAGGCNVGLRAAQGDVLVLLNQDVVVRPGWLRALIDALADEQVGIAGAKLLAPDGRTVLHGGAYLEWPLILGRHIGQGEIDEGQHNAVTDIDYVTGASLAVKRAVLDRIGLLDERFYPAFFEDIDFCWRARQAGWRVRYEPRAVALHDEASSTCHHWPSRHYYHYRNRLLFLFKHFTLPQILEEFTPAEKKRISHLPSDELRAGRVAIVEILAMWPVVAQDLLAAGVSRAEMEELLEALQMLRERIVRQQGGDPALAKPRPPDRHGQRDGETENSRRALADSLVDELEALWKVRESPFTSRMPIVGRWIVAFRNLWNSVAAKWYVRPLLAQQVQFNGAVVRALAAMAAQPWDDGALLALLAERCGMMASHIAQLETRLARIEEQLGP